MVAEVLGTQTLAPLLVSAPIQLAAASQLPRGARRWLFPAGLAIMMAGPIIEATADRQTAVFMAEKRKAKKADEAAPRW